jgi:hypothetical protein
LPSPLHDRLPALGHEGSDGDGGKHQAPEMISGASTFP